MDWGEWDEETVGNTIPSTVLDGLVLPMPVVVVEPLVAVVGALGPPV